MVVIMVVGMVVMMIVIVIVGMIVITRMTRLLLIGDFVSCHGLTLFEAAFGGTVNLAQSDSVLGSNSRTSVEFRRKDLAVAVAPTDLP